jgi:hypothetical protein
MKNHLFNMHHKIKLQLDAICQEAGDMDVEEFMQVYESLKPKPKSTPDLGNIGKKFQENMIDDMFSDMDMDLYDNI